MTFTKDSNIGDIVAKDYNYAQVFKKYNIDYCCNGEMSIGEASKELNLNPETIIQDLNSPLPQTTSGSIDYTTWPLDLLIDYIIKKHHRYIKHTLPELLELLAKIARVHGDRHPELFEVFALFKESADEIIPHMEEEEGCVFHNIKKLEEFAQDHSWAGGDLQPLLEPVKKLIQEHDRQGDIFKKLEKITSGYTVPEDGCNSYRVAYAMLKEYQEDLFLHIHIENNILFPRTLELEQQLS